MRTKIEKYKEWYIPENDNPGKKLIRDGFQCIPSLNIAIRHVKKFHKAIDVGAWIGDSTVFLSEKFDQVIAFEANPITFESCIKNIKERKIENVVVNQIGISNQIGQKQLYSRLKSTNSAWLSDAEPPTNIATMQPINIQTTTLDELNIPDVDFIKIDVDSHEGFVILGGMNWLSENSPIVMIENKRVSHNRQSDMPEPDYLLRKCGYGYYGQIGKADFIYRKIMKR
jgi:FkbM family methyltransferase